jgi:hypothetical protein
VVKTAKFLISLWLVYHLFIIALFPNTQSLLSRQLDTYLLPYANLFNMNTPWQFFSPTPGPKMYIEYEVSNTQTSDLGTTQIESKKYYWPPQEHKFDFESFRRRLYSARFMAVDPERLKEVFIPWICRQHPDAMMVSLEVIMAPIPNVEKAATFSNKVQEMEKPTASTKMRGDCPRANTP